MKLNWIKVFLVRGWISWQDYGFKIPVTTVLCLEFVTILLSIVCFSLTRFWIFFVGNLCKLPLFGKLCAKTFRNVVRRTHMTHGPTALRTLFLSLVLCIFLLVTIEWAWWAQHKKLNTKISARWCLHTALVWAKTKDLRDGDKRPPFQDDTHISCWWVLGRWVSILISIYSCSFPNCASSSMLINGYVEAHVLHSYI